MGFHDVRFPDDIAYGSSGGPGFRTDVIEVDSGAEERVSRLAYPRHRFDVSYGIRSYEQLAAMKRFFIARKGGAYGFRFKDFSDFATTATGMLNGLETTALDVQLGVGDGVEDTFMLRKYYSNGGVVRTRWITKPVDGTVAVAVNGTTVDAADYTVNLTTGAVVFDTPPADGSVVTWGGQFDVPVRFAASTDDMLKLSLDDFSSGSAHGLELVELLEATEGSEEPYLGGAMRLDPLSATYQLAYSDQRVVSVAPSADGKKLRLPDPADGAAGWPHFVVLNVGSHTCDVCLEDDTPVVTLAAGAGRHFCIGVDAAGEKEWVYL